MAADYPIIICTILVHSNHSNPHNRIIVKSWQNLATLHWTPYSKWPTRTSTKVKVSRFATAITPPLPFKFYKFICCFRADSRGKTKYIHFSGHNCACNVFLSLFNGRARFLFSWLGLSIWMIQFSHFPDKKANKCFCKTCPTNNLVFSAFMSSFSNFKGWKNRVLKHLSFGKFPNCSRIQVLDWIFVKMFSSEIRSMSMTIRECRCDMALIKLIDTPSFQKYHRHQATKNRRS